MIGRKKAAPAKTKTAEVDTLIGQETTVKGDLSFSGGLHVEGKIIGNVRSSQGEGKAMLILNESGSIEGDVEVANMLINGTVTGDVYSTEHCELAPNARINGNVYYKIIEMAVGAQINGNLVHRPEAEASKTIDFVSKDGGKGKAAGVDS
ncbi:MAG: bactofilin family protein [bacterium]